jgi:hypothetical protein
MDNSAAGNVAKAINCNFVKNGGWGVNGSAVNTLLVNCGFGSGTQANASGTSTQAIEQNSVTYASGATPWNDPANGDFRIVAAAARAAGVGTFTQTQASYSGTVGYPDIGAAQHKELYAKLGNSRTSQTPLFLKGINPVADRIELAHPLNSTGKNLYAIVRAMDGSVWNTSTLALETYATASLANYANVLTEQGSASRFYAGAFPATAPAGNYNVSVYDRAGGAPAEGDSLLVSNNVEWKAGRLKVVS